MQKRSFLSYALLIAVSLVSFSGCGESGPTSITDGADQSAIEAYKQNEKELEMETINELDGEDVP